MIRFLGIVCLIGAVSLSWLALAGEAPQTGKGGKLQLKPLDPDEAVPGKGESPKLKPLDPLKVPPDNGEQPKLKPLDPSELPPGEKPKLQPGDKVEGEDEKPEDPKVIMARIAKNMEISEGNLNSKQTGKPTQDVQQKIIEDLDKLIKQQNDQNQGGSGQSSSSSSQDSSSSQNAKNSSDSNNSQQNQPGPKPMGQPKPDNGQKNNQPSNSKSNSQANKSNDPMTVEGNKIGTIANVSPNKNNDDHSNFWGDLPKAPRTQANTVGKHASMNDDYRKLLGFYRSVIAEKK
jgi:paraquat-inducible protein B